MTVTATPGRGASSGPAAVAGFLARLRYKPGWAFKVGGPGGRLLCVYVTAPDTLDPARTRCTQHQFPIPDGLQAAATPELARWVLGCVQSAEQHETAEWLQVDGRRPFWPHHGDGDPYEHVERWETP